MGSAGPGSPVVFQHVTYAKKQSTQLDMIASPSEIEEIGCYNLHPVSRSKRERK